MNGPAYRTFGSPAPYDFPDLRPIGLLDDDLPRWISFGLPGLSQRRLQAAQRRFVHSAAIAAAVNDSADGMVQDCGPVAGCPAFQAEASLRSAQRKHMGPQGRQLLSYNNTMIADSQWRNQGRSFDAVVANLHYERVRLGIFAASVVVPQSEGISHHQEGNNIYGAYGNIGNVPRSGISQPSFPMRTPLPGSRGRTRNNIPPRWM